MHKLKVTMNYETFEVEGETLDFGAIYPFFTDWVDGVDKNPETPPKPGIAVALRFIPFSLTEGPGGSFMLLLTSTQKCGIQLDPRDSKNNPAQLDGVPSWTTSNADVLTVTPSADGLSAEVTATGVVGSAQVNVTADARLGEETVNLSGTLDVEVKAGEAVSLALTAGTPSEQ